LPSTVRLRSLTEAQAPVVERSLNAILDFCLQIVKKTMKNFAFSKYCYIFALLIK